MAAPRVASLAAAEVEVWCREEKSSTARKTVWNQVRGLFKEGASEPALLWWLREEGRILGRLLLAREDKGLRVGLLRLPWEGAWSGSLRRLVEAVEAEARRRGVSFLRLPQEALDRLPPALEHRLKDLGFLEEPGVCHWHLRRTALAGKAEGSLPEGAELDGDEGRWAPGQLDAATLEAGLSALAAHGALDLWLEWPHAHQILAPPAHWTLVEERRPRSWRLDFPPTNTTTPPA